MTKRILAESAAVVRFGIVEGLHGNQFNGSVRGEALGVPPRLAPDEEGDLSEFLLRLRGEITWPSPEALKAQIFKDVARAQRYFRLAR